MHYQTQGLFVSSVFQSSGVRQGCPLSPLLFVIAIDILLRRLRRFFPKSLVRAFADDNAMVVRDFPREGGGILGVYREFAIFSGLRLNIPKTVVVPLWVSSLTSIRRTLIADMMPEWSSADLSYSATYLGFSIGPARNCTLWSKTLDKYRDRTDLWRSTKVGLQYTIKTYNTFTLPVLSYLCQLAQPPQEVYEQERISLHKLSHGPGHWCTIEDLWYLSELFSFSAAFKSVRIMSQAAKLRTAYCEANFGGDCWDVRRKAPELINEMLASSHTDRRSSWAEWYKSSFTLQLDHAVRDAAAIDVNPWAVFNQLKQACSKDRACLDATTQAKGSLQRELSKQLHQHYSHTLDFENRVRHKITRWKLAVPKGILPRRVLRTCAFVQIGLGVGAVQCAGCLERLVHRCQISQHVR